MVLQYLVAVATSSSSAAPKQSWELCRMPIGNPWFARSIWQALGTHGSLEVTLVALHWEKFLQKIFTKGSFTVGVQQQHRLLQMSPPSTYSFKCQIQLQIIKLPPNKRRLVKGCGCFMWFLLDEGDYFPPQPSAVGLAAKIPALQIKALTTGQSANMKIRLVFQENLFLWPEDSFFQPQVLTEISQLRPIKIFCHIPAHTFLCSRITPLWFLTCKMKQKKFLPKQTLPSRYKRWQTAESRVTSYIIVQNFWA